MTVIRDSMGLGSRLPGFKPHRPPSLSVPQFPHLKSEDDKSAYLVGFDRGSVSSPRLSLSVRAWHRVN